MGWRRISSFSKNSTRMGRAVTAQDMPMPRMNCHSKPLGPIHPGCHWSRKTAARQPSSRGEPRARPAVMLVSPLCFQACFRSSSMPAMNTKIITAHQAMPFRDWMTGLANTKL